MQKEFVVQYKKQGVVNAKWFSIKSYNNQSIITNLEAGVSYEFRVGATCDSARDGLQTFVYSDASTFTMPVTDALANGYNCGIIPLVNIQNQIPLTNLLVGESFKAGDFPVTVLELSSSSSPYSGVGYIGVPYLTNISLAVQFKNIVINTDYQLISGSVETSYKPDRGIVVNVDPLIDAAVNAIDNLLEINIFGANTYIPETNTSNNANTSNTNQNTVHQTTTESIRSTANSTNITNNTATTNTTATTTKTSDNGSNTTFINSPNTTNNTVTEAEKLIFEATKLTASNSQNKTRIAKEGETLYYVNSGEKPETDIILTINPNIAKDKIKNYVHWFSNNTAIDKSEGLLKFRPKDLDKDATIKSVAGSPTESTKSVDVKFVDENYSKTKLTLGTTSNPFFKKALELNTLMEKISSKLDKIPFFKRMLKNENVEGKIGFYFDIIAFEQELKNKEDKESRLYYQEKKMKGGIDIGLSGSVRQIIWGLPIDKIPVVGDKLKEYISAGVYVVGTAKTGGELKGEHIEYKYVNNQEWKEISNQVNPAVIKLDVDFGVGAEVKFLKKNDYLSFNGDANGKAKAEIFTIGWRNNNFQCGFMQNGVFIDFQATFSGTFLGKKLETTPYYQRVVLVEPQTVQ